MTLPFTGDEFFDALSAYNERLWPFVLMLWLVTAYAVVMPTRARPVRPWFFPGLLAVIGHGLGRPTTPHSFRESTLLHGPSWRLSMLLDVTPKAPASLAGLGPALHTFYTMLALAYRTLWSRRPQSDINRARRERLETPRLAGPMRNWRHPLIDVICCLPSATRAVRSGRGRENRYRAAPPPRRTEDGRRSSTPRGHR